MYAQAVAGLDDGTLLAAIAQVLSVAERAADTAPGTAVVPVVDRWRAHRGSLCVCGMWAIGEARRRGLGELTEQMARLAQLQRRGGWDVPPFVTGAPADLVAALDLDHHPLPARGEIPTGPQLQELTEQAWALTRAICPRQHVRRAAVDAAGQLLNSYPALHPVDGAAPDQPWALPLTNGGGRFAFVVLDLDAHGAGRSADAAHRDTTAICAELNRLRIEHLVCESGPSRGRHIWIALADQIDADLVARLARLLQAALTPTLDLSPLTNAGSGCVRPPGSPHRDGGHSTILAGDPQILTAPSTTAAQITALIEHLVLLLGTVDARVGAADGPTTSLVHGVGRDAAGAPHLLGARRPLPRWITDLAALPPVDASATLWTILRAAVIARWRLADVVLELTDLPGFEHVRTVRTDGARQPRPRTGTASPSAVLARQWSRAVADVATRPPASQTEKDPALDARADTVVTRVRALQARADASPGRWNRRGGAADRLILDALSLLTVQAIADGVIAPAAVEADTRRLAMLCGLSRETAGRALHRLRDTGWISLHQAAQGPHGAKWTLHPAPMTSENLTPTTPIHSPLPLSDPQGNPRPEGAALADRSLLLQTLHTRLDACRHDAFVPTALNPLGPAAAVLYSRLPGPGLPTPRTTVTTLLGDTPQVDALITELHRAGLITATPTTVTRTEPAAAAAHADQVGTTGTLAARAATYELERAVWAWWLAELAWMQAPGRNPRSWHRRRRAPGQTTLPIPLGETPPWIDHPPYPRTADGRADYRAAVAHLRNNNAEPAAA